MSVITCQVGIPPPFLLFITPDVIREAEHSRDSFRSRLQEEEAKHLQLQERMGKLLEIGNKRVLFLWFLLVFCTQLFDAIQFLDVAQNRMFIRRWQSF